MASEKEQKTFNLLVVSFLILNTILLAGIYFNLQMCRGGKGYFCPLSKQGAGKICPLSKGSGTDTGSSIKGSATQQ